jgi:hypothetical protein
MWYVLQGSYLFVCNKCILLTSSSPSDNFAFGVDMPSEQTFQRKYKRHTAWCCHLTKDNRANMAWREHRLLRVFLLPTTRPENKY